MKYFLLLLFLLGCSKDYSIYNTTERGNAFITPKNCDLVEAKVIKWHIGTTFKQTVSKGFRIKIDFPILKKKDLISLSRDKGIDSWLITILKKTTLTTETIGSRYVPLTVPGNFSQNSLRIKQMKSGFIDIYYPAAALSKRFETFKCPAFNHSLIIDEMTLNKRKSNLKKMFISPLERKRVAKGVESFGYLPSVLNGGSSLEATYIVELSLYDSSSKMTQSSSIELPTTVSVLREKSRPLKGCTDFKIPPRNKEPNRIKSFRWKK